MHFYVRRIQARLNSIIKTQQLSLEPYDSSKLASLCGQCDGHLRQIEQSLQITINSRGNFFELEGSEQSVQIACRVLNTLYAEAEQHLVTPDFVHLVLQESKMDHPIDGGDVAESSVVKTKRCSVKARGKTQQAYVDAILKNDINFGIGPAGTGKTYLAVACAVAALEQGQVSRILLVRPAVEAGEKLGFLPGDLADKVNPYLRPLYDALYEMLGFEWVTKLIERHVIEIAPLAYMRGRTLNSAFVILDESQNTTREQMKMFLTRLGFDSKAVITGDCTQVDLPKGTASGLAHAIEVLAGVEGIGFTQFSSRDVVRHPLVRKIVEAYESHQSTFNAMDQA